jgi:hypothetical protein
VESPGKKGGADWTTKKTKQNASNIMNWISWQNSLKKLKMNNYWLGMPIILSNLHAADAQ